MSRINYALPICAAVTLAIVSCRDYEPTSATAFAAPRAAQRSLVPGCTSPVLLPVSGDIGLNVHGFASLNASDDAARKQFLQLLVNAKLGWARVDVEWRSIQLSGPSDWNWTEVDSTMARAYCAGVNVLGTLTYTPTWASSNPTAAEPKNYNPVNSTDWTNFVSAAVSRYPWVKYWTIWNEPNSPVFYAGGPRDYANLVGWAAPAIRANGDGQGVRYLVAGELSQENTGIWIDTLLYLQSQNVDVLSAHTYGDTGAAAILGFARRASVAASGKPVWLTETNVTGCHENAAFQGTATCVDVNGARSASFASRSYIDDDIQAAYADSMVAQMRRSGTAWNKTFFYDATEEVEAGPYAQDYGVFGGFLAHALYGKRAYYHLAASSGVTPQLSVAGPTMLSGGASANYSATVTGGRAASTYYYEWRFKCTPRSAPTGECNGGEFVWDEGWGLTTITVDAPRADGTAMVTAYIRETDLDSPVSPAYAGRASKKVSVSRF